MSLKCRKAVKSQSPLIGAFVPGNRKRNRDEYRVRVSIPSDRGIRSGLQRSGMFNKYGNLVSIPSDRGIRSGNRDRISCYMLEESQSPLIGAFVPGVIVLIGCTGHGMSQSPLIGAFVPGKDVRKHIQPIVESQSPLIGAFVPGQLNQ